MRFWPMLLASLVTLLAACDRGGGDAQPAPTATEVVVATPVPAPAPVVIPKPAVAAVPPDEIAHIMGGIALDPGNVRSMLSGYSEAQRTYIGACMDKLAMPQLVLSAQDQHMREEVDRQMALVGAGSRSSGMTEGGAIMMDATIVRVAARDPDELNDNTFYRLKMQAAQEWRQLEPVLRMQTGVDLRRVLANVVETNERMYRGIIVRSCT